MYIVLIKILTGLALLVAPRFFPSDAAFVVNSYFAGALVLLLAIAGIRWNLISRCTGVIIGIWLIVAPFVLYYQSAQAIIATHSLGVFVTLLFALFNGTLKKKTRKIPAICIL